MREKLRALRLSLLRTWRAFRSTPNKLFFLLRHRMVANVAAFALVLSLEAVLIWMSPETFQLKDAAEFVTILTSALLAGLLFFEGTIRDRIARRVASRPHTVVLGLSPATSRLIHQADLDGDRDYLVIDDRTDLRQMDSYVEKGMGFVRQSLDKAQVLKTLNLETAQQIVISTGSDTRNLEIAAKLIDLFERQAGQGASLRLVIEIEERSFDSLLFERLESRVLASQSSETPYHIEIQTFSFHELCAKQLFQTYDVDARDRSVIDSDRPFEIVVCGSGRLFEEIIYQIGIRAHLPNRNPLTVHLVHERASRLREQLKRQFPGIEKVMQLSCHDCSADEAAFYELPLWTDANLTRVILCEDDDVRNIETAGQLYDRIYRRCMAHGESMPEVFFSSHDAQTLSRQIHKDEARLKYFHPFGDRSTICTPAVLLDDTWNTIAHIVHFVYADDYDPGMLPVSSEREWQAVKNKWFQARVSDRRSSKAQAYHIPVKLKALGLRMRPSKLDPEILLQRNRQLLDEVLSSDRKAVGLDDAALHDYSRELSKCYAGEPFEVKYFPGEPPRNLFEKLIHCEHDRWNAYHYMSGWRYAPKKNKEAKEHDCLKPLSAFDTPGQQLTVIYDIYSILYIPNYLASAGFELIRDARP